VNPVIFTHVWDGTFCILALGFTWVTGSIAWLQPLRSLIRLVRAIRSHS